jgi:hypothetical protein
MTQTVTLALRKVTLTPRCLLGWLDRRGRGVLGSQHRGSNKSKSRGRSPPPWDATMRSEELLMPFR